VAKASATASPVLFPDDLIEKWRRQQRLARIGKLQVRRDAFYLGRDPIPPEEIHKFLDDANLGRTPDPVSAPQARFPLLPKRGTIFYEIIDDGVRRRNISRFEASSYKTDITVSNGLEVVTYNRGNAQADVFDTRKGGPIAVQEGWFGTAFKGYGVRAIPSAALIDRQGHVVFIGRFNEALQQTASLLAK
jgi:hypothetical protein